MISLIDDEENDHEIDPVEEVAMYLSSITDCKRNTSEDDKEADVKDPQKDPE